MLTLAFFFLIALVLLVVVSGLADATHRIFRFLTRHHAKPRRALLRFVGVSYS